MKHLKIILLAVLTFGAVSITQAQSKVAHISTNKLLEDMPEMKDARAELDRIEESYSADLDDMLKELEEKRERFEADAENLSDEENQKNVLDFQESQQRIQQFQQNAQKELQEKQEQLMKPVLEKAEKAIDKVAADKGYDYVLDSTEGGGVLVAKGSDIMTDVKSELGIN